MAINQQSLSLPCKRNKEKKCIKIESNYSKGSVLLLIYIVIKDIDYNPFSWDESFHMHCSLKIPSPFPLGRDHWSWWRETEEKAVTLETSDASGVIWRPNLKQDLMAKQGSQTECHGRKCSCWEVGKHRQALFSQLKDMVWKCSWTKISSCCNVCPDFPSPRQR